MNKGTIFAMLAVVGYFGLEFYGVQKAQHRLEPLFILDQFVAADQATARCAEPEGDDLAQFRHNLGVVRARAARELREAEPALDESAIDSALAARDAERREAVDALVEAGGCDDPEVRTLVRGFEIRARLRLHHST